MLLENEYNILLKRSFYYIIRNTGFEPLNTQVIQLYLSHAVIFRLWKYQKWGFEGNVEKLCPVSKVLFSQCVNKMCCMPCLKFERNMFTKQKQ